MNKTSTNPSLQTAQPSPTPPTAQSLPSTHPDHTFRSFGKGPWAHISDTEWNDPAWQLRHRITDLATLQEHLELTETERLGVILSGSKLAMAITPYFFTLIDRDDPHCPIRAQVVPRADETHTAPDEMADPCGEDTHMPVPGLVHRYPDRVLLLTTDRCASYCRYCTRSRVVSGVGDQQLETRWEAAFRYLEKTPQVRDVLLSGGDPLLLSPARLEKILARLHAIEHIEFIRIGTRIPIFLPQRITDELCATLKKYHPLFLSIHTNHPRELTTEAKTALARLADAGIPLGNQSVLLRDINDDPTTQRILVHKLLRCRVRPYYLYQCDLIEGSAHLRADIARGVEIIESLRGHTTGYAIPQYVIDAPGGGGKIPINPNYIIQSDPQTLTLRNYENHLHTYPQKTLAPANS